MKFETAVNILDTVKPENVRFSGGEPTLWKRLVDLVAHAKFRGVKHIAISTNGSASTDLYQKLIDAGVNDFSVSLDACCAETGDKMAGSKSGAWQTVVNNIKFLSKQTYVTVGVVLTEENIKEFHETVLFAHSLGVADIRVISASQWNERLKDLNFSEDLLNAHPILKYRINNFRSGRHVRGIGKTDNQRCPLALDDMAVLDGLHFPCIIYMREQGRPIGKVGPDVREQRQAWAAKHDTHSDPICRGNCLDVCVDYNNRYRDFHPATVAKPRESFHLPLLTGAAS